MARGMPQCLFAHVMIILLFKTVNRLKYFENNSNNIDKNIYISVIVYEFLEIICPVPSIPKNGLIIDHEKYSTSTKKRNGRVRKVGALLRFVCQPGHQLLGEGSIICMENGTWSHNPPTCKYLNK